jgi:hypothetical protein
MEFLGDDFTSVAENFLESCSNRTFWKILEQSRFQKTEFLGEKTKLN